MIVIVDSNEVEVPKNYTLDELATKLYGSGHNKLLARVNGHLRELFFEISENMRIEFLDINDKDGKRAYERAILFLFIKSVHDEYKEEVSGVNCEYSIGNGIFCEIRGAIKIDNEFIERIRGRMRELVEENLPFEKMQLPTSEAVEKFLNYNLEDKKHLFRYRRGSTTNIYRLCDYTDYFYGYLPTRTGLLTSFDLIEYEGGVVVVLPKKEELQPIWKPQKLLFYTMKESNSWGRKVGIDNVGDLNDAISHGRINDVVLVSEALQEGKIAKIAESIAENKNKRIVMIAGPSSSGKTTFSHRLSIELMVHGLRPHPIAADDYFKNREDTPRDENGEYDFESIEAIDTPQFNKDMLDLIEGREVRLPKFNFITGRREYRKDTLKLLSDDILVIEGIHCLNDEFSKILPRENKFKIYISALTQLNIDNHNRIHTTDLRLLRRMIRDARTRGNSAEDTLARWSLVRAGEEKNIFPFQEDADVMFDSSMIYELSVLKQYAEPLLFGISRDSKYYTEANRLLKFLNYFLGMPAENIPKNSLVREFIGGNCFSV